MCLRIQILSKIQTTVTPKHTLRREGSSAQPKEETLMLLWFCLEKQSSRWNWFYCCVSWAEWVSVSCKSSGWFWLWLYFCQIYFSKRTNFQDSYKMDKTGVTPSCLIYQTSPDCYSPIWSLICNTLEKWHKVMVKTGIYVEDEHKIALHIPLPGQERDAYVYVCVYVYSV